MSAPSPAFLRWWAAEHAATRAFVDSGRSGVATRRYLDACDEHERAARELGPEDWALVDSFISYTRAVRERIEVRARREEP